MASTATTLNWKRIGTNGLIKGLLLTLAALAAVGIMTTAGRVLGWPAEMVSLSNTAAVIVVALPFAHQAVSPLLSEIRRTDLGEGSDAYTLSEISITANSVRRRHYQRHVATAIGSALVSLAAVATTIAAAVNRASLTPLLQDTFGASARLNFGVMVAMLAAGGLLFGGLAVRWWRHRYQNEDESVADAIEQLDR